MAHGFHTQRGKKMKCKQSEGTIYTLRKNETCEQCIFLDQCEIAQAVLALEKIIKELRIEVGIKK